MFVRTAFLALLAALLCFSCSQAEEMELVESSQEFNADVLPAIPVPEMDLSGSYAEDSLEMLRLWERSSFFGNNNLYDSALETCSRMILLGGHLLETKFDSSLYEKYAASFGGAGWNLMCLGRYDEALAYSKYSLEKITERFGENHIRSSELCVGISFNYFSRGDYGHALEYQFKGLHIVTNVFPEGHYYLNNLNRNIGDIYRMKGDPEKAVEFYLKVRDFWGAVFYKDPGFQSIVECYLEMNDLESARRIVDEGSINYHATTHENLLDEVFFRYGQAMLYEADGRPDLAEEYTKRLTTRLLEEGDPMIMTEFLCRVLVFLGKVQAGRGKIDESVATFREAIAAWDEHSGFGSQSTIPSVLEIAKLQARKLDYQAALEEIRLGLERTVPDFRSGDVLAHPDLKGLSANSNLVALLTEKASILKSGYVAEKKPEYLTAAWETARHTIDFIQRTRDGYLGQDSKLALSQKAMPLVETLLACAGELNRRTNDPDYLKEGFMSVEKIKSIVLLENLNTSYAQHVSNLSEEIQVAEKGLTSDLAFYDKLILEEGLKGAQRDSVKLYYWHRKRLAVKEAHDSLMQVVQGKYPEFYHLKQNLPISSVEEVQKFLGKDEGLVNYFLGDTMLAIFSLTRNEFFFHQLAWTATQDSLLDAFCKFVGRSGKSWDDRQREDWVKRGRELFQMLLPAWNAQTLPSSLVVIPDGKLDYLPFHLLQAEPSSGKSWRNLPYLLRYCDVRYQFSASLLTHPLRSGEDAELDYAGFAPSYDGSEFIASRSGADSSLLAGLYPEIARNGLARLSHNQPEVEKASALWKARPYLAEQATERRFKETGTRARLLHLAMHALTNDQEPLLSQLVFSRGKDTLEDGRLHNYELQNLRLSADLTVLSACNTGAGQLRRGEGVMSVSRAFRLAGCPNIVMSLWQANDKSTSMLITRFFEQLKKGNGKAAALRESSLHYLSVAEEPYTHPFFWGNMMLIGDDEPIRAAWPRWGYWVIALLVSGLVFFRMLSKASFQH